MPMLPEPPMTLHLERTIDTYNVRWPYHRLTANDNRTKRLYDADKVKLWRALGYKTFRGDKVPPGHVARVVVYYRQPPGRGKVRDVNNLRPISKAIIDGMTGGFDGRHPTGLWPDDSTKYVLGQDERELLPSHSLEIVVQVWIAPSA